MPSRLRGPATPGTAFLSLAPGRLRSAALVCKRWHELTADSQLLEDVSVWMRLPSWDEAADFEGRRWVDQRSSFMEWLRRHVAPSVRDLSLNLDGLEDVWRADEHGQHITYVRPVPGLQEEFLEAVAACGAAGRLVSLEVRLDATSLVTPHWSELAGLTRLALQASGPDGLGPNPLAAGPTLAVSGLGALSALRDLELAGLPLAITDAALPPGLTHLSLASECEDLPEDLPEGATTECIPLGVGALSACPSPWACAPVWGTGPRLQFPAGSHSTFPGHPPPSRAVRSCPDMLQLAGLTWLRSLALANINVVAASDFSRLEGSPRSSASRFHPAPTSPRACSASIRCVRCTLCTCRAARETMTGIWALRSGS
jgi:hypothetical protein